MSAPTTKQTLIGRIWIGVRFVLFGLTGFYICIMSGIFALDKPAEFYFLLPLSVLGLLMMLFGVGRWGQWRYLLVFGSMPVCLLVLPWLYYEATSSVVAAPLPFIGALVVPFFVLVPVRRFYQSQAAQKDVSQHDDAAA
jgi:hypothetical protein